MQKAKSKTKYKLWEERILCSMKDTHQLAQDVADFLEPCQILGLQGEMGSGKTYFVKALAEVLGLESEEAVSPTFAIHQLYQMESKRMHHVDLYRLQTDDEVESCGFWDLFYENPTLIAIEWIDRIDEQDLPRNFSYTRLQWEVISENKRKVQLLKLE